MATDDRDPTWRYPWPAGRRLAEDLPHLLDWTGLRICELGCGQGIVGRAALTAGAASVTFTDISQEPLDHLTTLLGQDPRVQCLAYAWGEPLPGGPYDLMVGGDILYRPAFFDRLANSIGQGLASGGFALLADPRTELEPELTTLLTAEGLTVTIERRPGPYTLLRAHRP